MVGDVVCICVNKCDGAVLCWCCVGVVCMMMCCVHDDVLGCVLCR